MLYIGSSELSTIEDGIEILILDVDINTRRRIGNMFQHVNNFLHVLVHSINSLTHILYYTAIDRRTMITIISLTRSQTCCSRMINNNHSLATGL